MPILKPTNHRALAYAQSRRALERYRGYGHALTNILRDTKKLEGDGELAMLLELALIVVGQRLGKVKEPSEMTEAERVKPIGLVSFK